jgi:ubiquinone/menaquinone biosynthesis C-methylase UbiE
MNEHAEFWSKVAGRYDSVIDRQVGSESRRRLRERIAAEEGTFGRAAEFGCGTGFFTNSIASRSDTLVAVDLAPGMIQVARSRCPAAKITFRNEDCQKTSIGNASLDTAFLSLVIHFTEPAITLREMRRILKPGGALAVINLDPLALSALSRLCAQARILYYGITRYRTRPPRNFGKNVISARDLSTLLVKTGTEMCRWNCSKVQTTFLMFPSS